ncbi:hypothetical protein D9611_003709 [Ephemerocybe angulata]|uniref:BTB domain-containing protein n=1 Tax=Ephemerocybe angulata TaxID=980116 RepID=A0A8H5B6C2_9AGAR|nr:hypothetical protein D9611_003709 [Tulosesus angulatus]
MDNAPEVAIVPESMTSITEPAIEKDEEYYWSDNVWFLVQGRLFRVSRHQFIIGSKYFSDKYHLGGREDEGTTDIVPLDGVTAAEFRVFLRIVFPSHTTSTTTSFTKDEWLTILKLSVRWHFHDFRKLAIEHLDGGLTDIELIKAGRAAYVPRWVLSGYQRLVEREGIITVDEADEIGNRTVNTLWIVRYLMDRKALDGAIENELAWRFSDEISMLEAEAVQRRTAADIELEAKRAEEERRLEEEQRVKAVAEQLKQKRLEEERLQKQEEQRKLRLEEEESRQRRGVLITHPDVDIGDTTIGDNESSQGYIQEASTSHPPPPPKELEAKEEMDQASLDAETRLRRERRAERKKEKERRAAEAKAAETQNLSFRGWREANAKEG